QNAPLSDVKLPGAILTPSHEVDNEAATFDLLFELGETQQGMSGWLKYRTDAFEGGTARRLVEALEMILTAAGEDPGRRISELQMPAGLASGPAAAAPAASPARPAQPIERLDDAIEQWLIRTWEDLLGVSPIGIRDNFFELGGHSLLAAGLMAAI